MYLFFKALILIPDKKTYQNTALSVAEELRMNGIGVSSSRVISCTLLKRDCGNSDVPEESINYRQKKAYQMISLLFYGVPKGVRTPVTAVKGQCPRPLDDGD